MDCGRSPALISSRKVGSGAYALLHCSAVWLGSRFCKERTMKGNPCLCPFVNFSFWTLCIHYLYILYVGVWIELNAVMNPHLEIAFYSSCLTRHRKAGERDWGWENRVSLAQGPMDYSAEARARTGDLLIAGMEAQPTEPCPCIYIHAALCKCLTLPKKMV